jgi:hypothetical protein
LGLLYWYWNFDHFINGFLCLCLTMEETPKKSPEQPPLPLQSRSTPRVGGGPALVVRPRGHAYEDTSSLLSLFGERVYLFWMRHQPAEGI